MGGKGFRAVHNEVHDTPYSGINGSGDGGRIEGNRIYRSMLELHDGAGIYTGFCKGIVIRRNLIRDITDTGGYGASAYYLDEQAEGFVVEENVSIGVTRPSHNHMARNNTIRNNLFVTDGDMTLTFPRSKGYLFEKNVLVAGGSILFQASPDGIERMPGNVIHAGKGTVTLETLDDYATTRKEPMAPRDGSVLADPLLIDGKGRNAGFRSGSPALRLGIRPFRVEDAGPRQGP